MEKYFIIVIFITFSAITFSYSQEIKSIHQEQSEFYSDFKFKTENDWNCISNFDENNRTVVNRNSKGELTKEVFGWNPYWMGTSYYNFDYSLLSEVSYFSYEVNYLTGLPDDIHYWKTTELVDYCHNNGVKVSLTATLFENHQAFLENSTSVENFIDTIIKLVQFRNAEGVNIDFEMVSSSQKNNFTAFMIQLSNELHTQIPNSRLSIALPAVDWGLTFDVAAMNDYIDIFLIMGYEYYWSGSSQAGPGAPKNGGDLWGSYNTTKSINDYLNRGVSPEKLCLAVPYYGREWSTESNSIPSNTTSSGTAVIYSAYKDDYLPTNEIWDFHSSTPVNVYNNAGSGWKQCWQNDEKSLGYKYDYINLKNIGGIGIWALGYDGSYSELWDMLTEKFTPSGNNICEDVFTDTGGPFGQYYNNEDWIYTIAPENPTELKIVFTGFEVELNYDTLFIYDGLDTLSNLIGAFTGTEGPTDTLISETGAFTFRFKTDNATVKEGWNAHWTCDNFTIDIKENTSDFDFKIYPNPFTDNITVDFGEFTAENVEINIFNILGQKVYSQNFKNHDNSINISTENLKSNSVYILKIKSGNKEFVEKIVKQ